MGDWQINKDLATCGRYMLDNEINTDVEFRIGKEETVFKAHKIILAMRSPVFHAMFFGTLREGRKPIKIPDVDPAGFRTLLRYCYSDCTETDPETGVFSLYAAKKYILPVLEDAIVKDLQESLGPNDCWQLFTYSKQWHDKRLEDACHHYFTKGITEVMSALKSPHFIDIPHEVLQAFLRFDRRDPDITTPQTQRLKPAKTGDSTEQEVDGSVPGASEEQQAGAVGGAQGDKDAAADDGDHDDIVFPEFEKNVLIHELDIFKACNTWAEAECGRQKIKTSSRNKRKVLRDCYSLISFTAIPGPDLVKIVSPTGILTAKETVKIYESYLMHAYDQPTFLMRIQYSQSIREKLIAEKMSDKVFHDSIVLLNEEDMSLVKIWISTVKYLPPDAVVTITDELDGSSWKKKIGLERQSQVLERCGRPLAYLDFDLPYSLAANGMFTIKVKHVEKESEGVTVEEVTGEPLLHSKLLDDVSRSPKDANVKVTSDENMSNSCIVALTLKLED